MASLTIRYFVVLVTALFMVTLLRLVSRSQWRIMQDGHPAAQLATKVVESGNNHYRFSSADKISEESGHPSSQLSSSRPATGAVDNGPMFFTDLPRNQTTVNMLASRWEDILPLNKPRPDLPSDALWMPILGTGHGADKGGFVYSAFLDTRLPKKPLVRVLGTIPSEISKLLCRFHFARVADLSPIALEKSHHFQRPLWKADGHTVDVGTVSIEPQEPLDINKYPHHTSVFINCPLTLMPSYYKGYTSAVSLPRSVSIYPTNNMEGLVPVPGGNNIYIHQEPTMDTAAADEDSMIGRDISQPLSLAFCPKPIRNIFADVAGLVEYLELTSLLAGPRASFHFYGYSYTEQIECVLTQFYTKNACHDSEKDFKVYWHNYEIPFGTKYAKVIDLESETAINDCFYRSRASGAHFVQTADVDEFFFPNASRLGIVGPGALEKLLRLLSRDYPAAAAFEFKRENFNLEFPDDESVQRSSMSGSPSNEITNKLTIVRKTTLHRNTGLYPKLISNTARVTGVRTHGIVGITNEREYRVVEVNRKAAIAHHYRLYEEMLPEVQDMFRKKMVEHETVATAHSYRSLLGERVKCFLKTVPSRCKITERSLWMNSC